MLYCRIALCPFFIDPDTFNPNPATIQSAISPKTKAIFLTHTLGNPFAASEISAMARERQLWLIEDNCDALGAQYDGLLTGTFGDISTASFYPAHHISMGEGGCVSVDNDTLANIVVSLRNWGKDCWCKPAEDNCCGQRFAGQWESLPAGYDHKFVFSHIGYNMKSTDLNASLGLSQLNKLPTFISARQRNWDSLRNLLDDVPFLHFSSPTPRGSPSWFGFAITIASNAPFERRSLVAHLDQAKVRSATQRRGAPRSST
jgi:NDP-hexose-3,4-dehydratase